MHDYSYLAGGQVLMSDSAYYNIRYQKRWQVRKSPADATTFKTQSLLFHASSLAQEDVGLITLSNSVWLKGCLVWWTWAQCVTWLLFDSSAHSKTCPGSEVQTISRKRSDKSSQAGRGEKPAGVVFGSIPLVWCTFIQTSSSDHYLFILLMSQFL